MKKFSLLVLLVLIISITSVQATKKVTITLTCFPDLDKAFEKILPDFYKKYPNIEVNIIAKGYGVHHNDLVNAVSAEKDLPDVAVIEIGYIPQFVALGGFEDLNRPSYRAWQYKRYMAPYKWAQATDDDGRLIAFPLDVAPACAYWRRDRFAEAGVSIDDIKTMDDLFVAAGKLTRDTNGDGKIDQWFTSDASNIAYMILRSCPNRLVYREKYHLVWDTQRIRDAFTWAQKFKQAGYCANIGDWTNEWHKSFQDGSVAYEISGSWLGGHLKNWMAPKTAGLWGVSKLPSLNENENPMAGGWGGSFMGIPEKAKYKAEAWKFIKFVCTNQEPQMILFKVVDSIPAYTPAWKDPFFDENLEFLSGQQARRLWVEITPDIPSVYTSKYDNVMMVIIGAELTNVLNDGKDVEKAIADMKSQIHIRQPRG